MKKSGGIWFGIILVAVGVLLLLDNMYVVDFREVAHTYWPILLIIWGLSKVVRRSPARNTAGPSSPASPASSGSDADHLSTSSVFGDYTMVVRSASFTGGTISTTFGDIEMDLVNARLAQGEHSLRLEGVFGDTVLRLPKDMAFAVHAVTTFGDLCVNEQQRGTLSPSLDYSSPDFDASTKRLRIFASRVFGDVTVTA